MGEDAPSVSQMHTRYTTHSNGSEHGESIAMSFSSRCVHLGSFGEEGHEVFIWKWSALRGKVQAARY
jgi:hypothetical protein